MARADPWGSRLFPAALRKASALLEAEAHKRGWYPVTPEEQAEIELARRDFWAFFRYVFRHRGPEARRYDIQPFQHDLVEFLRENPRTIVELPNECGKSELHAAVELWLLAHAPATTSILIVSLTATMALKQADAIKLAIESNVRLQRVFPHLRKGSLWQRGSFSVAGNTSRIPSVQSCGRGGRVNGDRLTHVRIDDFVDSLSCRSAYQQENDTDWVESVLSGRLVEPEPGAPTIGGFPAAGTVRCVGHPWAPGDFFARMKAKATYHVFSRPAITTDTADPVREIRELSPEQAAPRLLWPAKWPLERLHREIENRGSTNFCRTLLMQVRDPSGQYFRDQWILEALRKGKDLEVVHEYKPPSRNQLVVPYDLASGEREGADSNVIAPLLWDVLGALASHAGCYVSLAFELDSGVERWTPDEHTRRIQDHANRYPGAEHVAEDNLGLGQFSKWAADKSKVRIRGMYAGAKKWDSQVGVAGVAIMMERRRWVIPAKYHGSGGVMVELSDGQKKASMRLHPTVARFVSDLQDYSETDRHLPDTVAATWIGFMALGGVQGRAPAVRRAPRDVPTAGKLTDHANERY